MTNPAPVLLELARRACHAESAAELRFMLVNDSHALTAYRQGVFFVEGLGIQAMSGVVQIEANAPYAQWLEQVCLYLGTAFTAPAIVTSDDLPAALAEQWNDWLPREALWLPMAGTRLAPAVPASALFLARDEVWAEQEITLLAEWVDIWWCCWRRHFSLPLVSARALRLRWLGANASGVAWWRRKRTWVLVVALLVLWIPVTLSVRAPGELVPVNPVAIRSPLEGVVDRFYVKPNQQVSEGQPLLALDDALLKSKLQVAQQALLAAETDYRQTSQLALSDTKSKGMLALQLGKIEERRAELDYLSGQLQRVRVLAPAAGVVLLDDPSEWIGRPVALGERIMRVAALDDIEVEVWLPMGDAIALPPQANVTLYLDASPFQPVSATLRYVAHEAQQRPDGTFAFRVRASLNGPTAHRVGLKGTARAEGAKVPLIYYLLRRPLANLRTALGF